jgi:hypothetical protein
MPNFGGGRANLRLILPVQAARRDEAYRNPISIVRRLDPEF